METFVTLGAILLGTEKIPKPEFFILGENGSKRACSESDIENQYYDTDNEVPVEVIKTGGAYYIESCDWFCSEGICRLTVNFFGLSSALRLFADLVFGFTAIENGTYKEAKPEAEAQEKQASYENMKDKEAEEAKAGIEPPKETKRNETFGAAICQLLCEIENEGGAIEEISKRFFDLEKAARAAYVESGSKVAFAVIEQFDIFEDIG